MVDIIVWRDDKDVTKVTLVREPKDEKEAIEMFLNPSKRFKTLMGITDDTLAIQYALDYGKKKTGRKMVRFDEGKYVIDRPLTLGHGVSLVGKEKDQER